ncbi:DM13 domain-containing protein [Pseudalkalibacillus berkeleyi]|uniref:DM13 domain-containing protein n=1 Tax=Pseudalkalibacillus berkeleyi TaxID=1069813 RepID=A0ABS9GXQ9_9BACL|nr:DM13 domain-containing protein [Pseudalkalibacillus berkeleyi]MCF6136383.1 DM13 domain-containing protein [Pseudalkalibacillus berkeleyi]
MKKIIAGVIIVGLLGVGWWLGSPLFLDKEVNEDAPMSSEEMMSDENMKNEEMMDDQSDEMDGKMKEMMMYSGTFKDADEKHKASGMVKTVDGEDGLYLRFEGFEVTNGPDLYVYLTKEGQQTKEGIELGKLKGNKGNQNYKIPEGTDLEMYNQVVVWCKSFDEDFGYAMMVAN